MSDTPKTDAFEALVNRPMNWWDFARELERENAALRATAVEACALARVWVTVWSDKLSAESIQRLEQMEKQILKKAQP